MGSWHENAYHTWAGRCAARSSRGGRGDVAAWEAEAEWERRAALRRDELCSLTAISGAESHSRAMLSSPLNARGPAASSPSEPPSCASCRAAPSPAVRLPSSAVVVMTTQPQQSLQVETGKMVLGSMPCVGDPPPANLHVARVHARRVHSREAAATWGHTRTASSGRDSSMRRVRASREARADGEAKAESGREGDDHSRCTLIVANQAAGRLPFECRCQ